MRHPGPALRLALLATGVTLLGLLLLAGWLGAHAHAYTSARDRATATADGLVVADDIGTTEDIRVRWTDGAGQEHVQRFEVYDTRRYAEGRRFPVAYDPGSADPRGFPADPEETSAEDNLLVPIGIAGAVGLLFCGIWAVRGLRFRLAARRPGRPATVTALSGILSDGQPVRPDSSWLAFSETNTDRGTGTNAGAGTDGPGPPLRWQRVMWHPVLDESDGPVSAVAHGRRSGRGATMVELPDGTRLVPLGRSRRHPPRGLSFEVPRTVRCDLRDAFVLPAGFEPPSALPWWRTGLRPAALGAAVGAVAGFLVFNGGPVGGVAFAVGGAAAFVNLWALSASRP